MKGPLSAGRQTAGAGDIAGSNVAEGRLAACDGQDEHEKLMACPATRTGGSGKKDRTYGHHSRPDPERE